MPRLLRGAICEMEWVTEVASAIDKAAAYRRMLSGYEVVSAGLPHLVAVQFA